MARKKKKKTTKPQVRLSNTSKVQTNVVVNTANPRRVKRRKAPLTTNYIPGQRRYLINPNERFNATIDPYVGAHYQSIINAKINNDISMVLKKLESVNKTVPHQRFGQRLPVEATPQPRGQRRDTPSSAPADTRGARRGLFDGEL